MEPELLETPRDGAFSTAILEMEPSTGIEERFPLVRYVSLPAIEDRTAIEDRFPIWDLFTLLGRVPV